MPTTYIPRLRASIIAVRATTDLIIPAGDWITIDDSDGVAVLTDAEFTAAYQAAPATPSLALPLPAPGRTVMPGRPRLKRPGIGTGSKHSRHLNTILTIQPGRIFYYLRSLGRPVLAREIKNLIALPDSPTSVSPCLADLTELGLVTKIEREGAPSLWEPTPLGCEMFDRTGPICFTRYDLQVPPDRASPPAPAKASPAKASPAPAKARVGVVVTNPLPQPPAPKPISMTSQSTMAMAMRAAGFETSKE